MEHHWFADRLSAWLDMGLPVMEQSAMDEHVVGCAECQAQAEKFRSLERLVGKYSHLRDDDTFFDNLAARTQSRLFEQERKAASPSPVIKISLLRWTTVAAGVILTSVVSWKLLEEQPQVRQLSSPIPSQTPETGEVTKSTSTDSASLAPMSAQKPTISDSMLKRESPAAVTGQSSDKVGRVDKDQEKEVGDRATDETDPRALTPSTTTSETVQSQKSNGAEGTVGGSAGSAQSMPLTKVETADHLQLKSSLAAPAPSFRKKADTSATKMLEDLRRLLGRYSIELDSVGQRLTGDSIRALLLQHPPLPPDLIQQLDSLGFGR